MNALFTTPLGDASDAEHFLAELHASGLSFHPDENARNIVRPDGSFLFTRAEADAVNTRIAEVFEHIKDPSEVLLNLIESTFTRRA